MENSKMREEFIFGSNTWNAYYSLAKKFYDKYGNLDVPSLFKTVNGYKSVSSKDGFPLGPWVLAQKTIYDNNRNAIPEKYLRMLEEIGIANVPIQSNSRKNIGDSEFDNKDIEFEDIEKIFHKKELAEALKYFEKIYGGSTSFQQNGEKNVRHGKK